MSHGLLLTFEITILVLAIFLGFEVISKVPTLLHTPLMSGTNAIHGIVIVGAMLVAGLGHKDTLTTVVGLIAVVLASANVVGGVFGAVAARRVRMTAMPQMVALFNGVGGGAAALISLAEFHNRAPDPGTLQTDISASIMLSAIIGSISFSGSISRTRSPPQRA